LSLPGHIVWDWNGTLQDDIQAAVNGINVLLEQRRLPLVDVERHRETFGFPVKDYYRALGFQLESEDWDAMAREFHDHFLSDRSPVLRPCARPTLEAFRRQGVGMSLLSASEAMILERLLSAHGIREFFMNVRGLDNLHARSKLDIGRELVQSLGVPVDRVWFIGDTDHDWEVSRAIGAHCLLLADGYQSPRRLARCGCPVLPSLGDVLPFFGLAAVSDDTSSR
jgi:phosphoglycolate phosphatase